MMAPGWTFLGTKPERLEVNWGGLDLERKAKDPIKVYKSTQKTSRGGLMTAERAPSQGNNIVRLLISLNALLGLWTFQFHSENHPQYLH